MKRALTLLIEIIAVTTIQCGGPITPTSTVVTITSSGPTMFLGAVEAFTGSVVQGTTGTKSVNPGGVWGSDAVGVATVDSIGNVTGVGSGSARIFVDFQGSRGTKLIRVLPNYHGFWVGNYAVVNCSQTGDFATLPFCPTFQIGQVRSLSLQFTQAGDVLSGQTLLGGLASDPMAPTPVPPTGQVTLLAVVHSSSATISVTWVLNMATAGHIVGTVNQMWTSTGLAGSATLSGTVLDTVLSHSVQAHMLREGPPLIVRTLAETMAAIR